ncbi:gluconokinase [Algoriphagus sediminis]|uniref:Gluconokinase n=1 Tax=Algoriphagus sediminis TaxID=3057113 RepID=A0ABT7Y8R1_9BACT|nr:gluconokinase [Algoriphagus sediminis]MDN3202910.1 gluconokinase [Algoriphagus sediminis]
MLIIVTGVSGTGKTTIGHMISSHLEIPFFDADDFHTKENIAKMSNGIPLTDEDRIPWLERLADQLEFHKDKGGAVLGCSALKEAYRKVLAKSNEIIWIHLIGSEDLIWERMKKRKNHYMKASMLSSQFEIWEKPSEGICLSIDESPEAIFSKAMDYILNCAEIK